MIMQRSSQREVPESEGSPDLVLSLGLKCGTWRGPIMVAEFSRRWILVPLKCNKGKAKQGRRNSQFGHIATRPTCLWVTTYEMTNSGSECSLAWRQSGSVPCLFPIERLRIVGAFQIHLHDRACRMQALVFRKWTGTSLQEAGGPLIWQMVGLEMTGYKMANSESESGEFFCLWTSFYLDLARLHGQPSQGLGLIYILN